MKLKRKSHKTAENSIQKKPVKKLKFNQHQHKLGMTAFILVFMGIGAFFIYRLQAAPGVCSTSGVVGTANYSISVPESAQYRLWVRMQVPDTTNTNNTNGVRVELAGNQCFTVTTTNSNTVNQWQWINSDALNSSTPHITTQIAAGNTTAKILGLKAGVKVDKVLLLKSDNTCVPSNNFTNGQPGDNCTTPAPNVSVSVSPSTIISGQSSTIIWNVTNATNCTASGDWTGAKSINGGSQSTGTLTSNKTYTLSCTGVGGSNTASTTITVNPAPAPTLTLTANPTSVVSGSASTLTWTVTNATSCNATGGWSGSKLASGGSQSTGALTANQTYNLSCSGSGGSIARSVTVTVTQSPPPSDTTPPAVTSSIPNVSITPGQTNVLINNQKSVTWTPLASDASGIKSLAVTVNGAPATLTNGSLIIGATANGDYVVRTTVTDNADNVTNYELTIRVRHPDFNRSGRVDIFDMSALLNNWNRTSTIYDINVNGRVDIFDLSYLLNRWNSTN